MTTPVSGMNASNNIQVQLAFVASCAVGVGVCVGVAIWLAAALATPAIAISTNIDNTKIVPELILIICAHHLRQKNPATGRMVELKGPGNCSFKMANAELPSKTA
jgi:hypothetical protein